LSLPAFPAHLHRATTKVAPTNYQHGAGREAFEEAKDYSAIELKERKQITINGITLTVRGAIVDRVARIGTFFVP
jgi:hypothetical protein